MLVTWSFAVQNLLNNAGLVEEKAAVLLFRKIALIPGKFHQERLKDKAVNPPYRSDS